MDCGVTLGVQINGSDKADVEDNDSGRVESDASMLIHTSVLGLPVAVDTDVKGMSLAVGVSVDWIPGDVSLGFVADDLSLFLCFFFDFPFLFPDAFLSNMISSSLASLPTWSAEDDVSNPCSGSPRFPADRFLQYLLKD